MSDVPRCALSAMSSNVAKWERGTCLNFGSRVNKADGYSRSAKKRHEDYMKRQG